MDKQYSLAPQIAENNQTEIYIPDTHELKK